jgi:phosphoglycerate dehydrogenase-like enzyme
MNIIALTRKPRKRKDVVPNNASIRYIDIVTTPDAINIVFKESDYILIATPLTNETRGMIGKEQFQVAKHGSVLINVGRGPVIKEDELIDELQGYLSDTSSNYNIKGAALDVTMIEPLPPNSLLWNLDNVLLSPHNMDMTVSFMYESTSLFIKEQLPRFIRNVTLLNPINIKDGY